MSTSTFNAKEFFDIKLDAWNHAEELSIERKESINKILGLNAENDYRVFVPVILTHADIKRMYPITSSFVKWVVEKAGYAGVSIDFVKNTVMQNKQERKITRILNKMFKDDPHILRTLNSTKEPHNFKDKIFPELKIENDKQFIPAWGERKVTGHLCISTNFHDLLTPSSNSSFSSCHRIGGEYYNSAMSHAVSDCSFMAYVTDDRETLKKIGRVWCLLSPNGKHFIHFGAYGTLHQGEFETLRAYVKEKLPGLKHEDNTLRQSNFCGYLDSPTYGIREEKEKLWRFNFHDPICLTCGKEFNHDCHDGQCNSCDTKEECCSCEED